MERGKVTNTSHHHNPKSPPTTTLPHNNNNNSPHQLNKCQHHQTITPHNLHSNSPLTILNAQNYFKEVTTTTNSSSNNTRVSPVVSAMNSQLKKNNNNAEISKTTMKTMEMETEKATELRNRPPRTAVSASALRNNRFNKPKAKNRASSYCPNSKPAWLLRNCPCFCKTSVQVKQPTANPKSKTPFTKIPPKSQSQLQLQPQQQQQKAVTISVTPNVTENFEEFQHHVDAVLGKPTTEGFTFPSLAAATPTATSCHGKKQVLNVVHEEYPIPPRHSLEVFQPIITVDRERENNNNNNNNNNNYRRRNMASPPSPLSRDPDDAASDASSDLFEIESFSLQAVAALLTCPQPVVTMAPTGSELNNDNNNKTSAAGAGKSSGSEFSAAAASEQQRQGAADNNSRITKTAEDTTK